MAQTQRDISLQMISQLRLLDPSASAEVGTPERIIIDTVAQSIFDSQVDLAALQSALNIDSYYGSALDRFLGIFGFARQSATYATGYVTFSRTTASTSDIRIPANSTVQAPADPNGIDSPTTDVTFTTLFDATLPAGDTSVIVPVRATVAGTLGNEAAGRITEIIGQPILGITAVTNDQPTGGGKDLESDEEFKVRFKNTVFRNLAGTRDQFLALAVATAFTSKANVVGPISTYREYIQVPPVDDASSYDPEGGSFPISGQGNAGEYTTALSTIPFAKYIYSTQQPVFVTNGDSGPGAVFFRQDTDFTFNDSSAATQFGDTVRDRGDTHRLAALAEDDSPTNAVIRPNVTFKNVYTGTSADVSAVRPGDVLLLEYSYLSEASRADFDAGIFNTVDVYVDGENIITADTVISRPTTASQFIDDPTSKFYYENYRRVGEPEKRPQIGNILTPLFWQPVTDLPDQIIVGTNTYNKGEHYWAVEDISNQGGTIRARAGIEWTLKVNGQRSGNIDGHVWAYTGQKITDVTPDTTDNFVVSGYSYDKNIQDLQASLTGSKQVTTDVLAHRSRIRYFKLDVTVMYARGASITDTNNQIQAGVDNYLRTQFYGSAVQLSDLLQIIHSVPGVDNVRWTADAPNSAVTARIFECDNDGLPLTAVTVDRIQPGQGTNEVQGLYITGAPENGTFTLKLGDTDGTPSGTTTPFAYNVTATELQSEISSVLTGLTAGWTATVTEDVRSNSGVKVPVRSFRITYSPSNTPFALPVVTLTDFDQGAYVIQSDFFLRDNELARLPSGALDTDTLPGLIIRPRAQNTWNRTR